MIMAVNRVIIKSPDVTKVTVKPVASYEKHRFEIENGNTLVLIGFGIEDGNTLVLD